MLPLKREITKRGTTLSAHSYRSDTEQGWIVEVKDHLRGSMVRDDELAIDRDAPDAAMSAEANTKVDRPARGFG